MVITAEHIATTIERIGTLCNELRDTNSSALPFVDRLQGVMLASELYDIAGQLDAQREETLSRKLVTPELTKYRAYRRYAARTERCLLPCQCRECGRICAEDNRCVFL